MGRTLRKQVDRQKALVEQLRTSTDRITQLEAKIQEMKKQQAAAAMTPDGPGAAAAAAASSSSSAAASGPGSSGKPEREITEIVPDNVKKQAEEAVEDVLESQEDNPFFQVLFSCFPLFSFLIE